MAEMFKQCELVKQIDDGLCRMISWIPVKIAVPNLQVRLKDSETGQWTEGWTVLNVTEPAVSIKLLERQSRDYLRTRDASDA